MSEHPRTASSNRVNHAPLPWRFLKRDGEIVFDNDSGAWPIAWTDADYEFIVRACNAHDGLLAALKEYHAANRLHHDEDARLYELSEAAIAKAEGSQS